MRKLALPLFLVLAAACARSSGVAAGEPASDRYLHLQLRVSETGDWKVVSAAEVPGKAVISDSYLGDYVYEVRAGDRVIAVESMPDPFETRGFGGPPGSPPGHPGERAATTTIVVKVPGMGLTGALGALSIRLLKIDTAGSSLSTIDAATLERLRREGRAKVLVTARGEDLAAQIRQKG